MSNICYKTRFLWLLLLLPFLGFSQSEAALNAYEARIFEGKKGWPLPYRILFPKEFDAQQKYPLVLVMHGAGERGNDNERQLVHGADLFLREGVRDSFPAIVVFPQCAEKDFWVEMSRIKTAEGLTWDYPFKEFSTPSMQLVEELLDNLLGKTFVDANRVYVTGLSMGGMATFNLLARFPDRFAAAAPICGGGNPLLTGLYAEQTPLWVFHGEEDEVVDVKYSQKMVDALRANGGNVRFSKYAGINHNSWENAFAEPELLPWFFSHKRTPKRERYVDPIFQGLNRETFTYAIKGGDTLQLDWYAPANDKIGQRPTVLFVHGGGFAGGIRDGEIHENFASEIASHGYTVVSMSYRLTMKGQSFSCDQPAPNKIRTFQLAVEDIRSATNYLLTRTEELGIDSNQLVIAGSSAGAEAILHAVFWEDDDLLPDSPKLPEGFQYAGLINMAGAMVNDITIDQENAVPALLFHGTCDPLVPFKTAPHHYCDPEEPGYLMLQGSYTIAEKYHALGRSYSLVTGCGIAHEWATNPMLDYVDQMIVFLKKQIIDGTFQQQRIRVGLTDDCEKGGDGTICPGE